ncbi:MAG: selenoprotein B glycine/betaine/sarcosine/D-proline reductase [Proteobacteria bacterium]|nr:selenoprotein B glycine/betaine/sarcosine/D-proline reductase [Burkholderiales bacterium]
MIDEIPAFSGQPWVAGPPLDERRVALITTSGIHRRDDVAYADGAVANDYRVIPGDVDADDLVMSHLSTNYDRTGFQQDANVVFPIDRLRELADEGVIASLARYHYAFMGAARLPGLEPKAREVAGLLKRDAVDAVLLTPV